MKLLKPFYILILLVTVVVSGCSVVYNSDTGEDDVSIPVSDETDGALVTDEITGNLKKKKVAKLQLALNSRGANLDIDGVLGPKTRTALRRFQKENNLKPTGKLNKETSEKLGIFR